MRIKRTRENGVGLATNLASAFACLALAMTGCEQPRETSYQGYVEGEFVCVAPAEAGRLERLSVVRGDAVTNGMALFTLEAEREKAALCQAQRQLESAEALLRDLQTGKRPPEVGVVKEQLAQAEAEKTRAAADAVRDEAQYQVGGISAARMETSRTAAETSVARVRELERQLEVAALPARDQQIRAQQAAVDANRAACDQAAWYVKQKSVAATVSGQVNDTLYREGEWVAAGRPVVRLLPPENVKIRFFVPEPVAGGLSVGQRVTFRRDGAASELKATVSYVSSEAEYTPPVIYSNETRAKLVYLIEAHPSAADAAALHPGQPVEVFLR